MSADVTAVGRNLDDALSKACEVLGVRLGEIHYEIVSSSGGTVAVRAEVDPVAVLGLFLSESFKAGNLAVRARVASGDGLLRVELEGDDVSLLTAGGGRGLDALQYLSNRVLNGRISEHPPVQLDTAGYKERRAQDLCRQAEDAAARAFRNRQPVILGPLTPAARREIHLALRDDTRVETESDGTGFLKRLVGRPRGRS
jgi:spoIIIJ-associated protein